MNKKEITQLGLTAVLVVAFLFLAFNAVKRISLAIHQGRSPVATVEQGGQPLKSSAGEKISYQALDKESKSLELKRDPFTGILLTPNKFSEDQPKLNGIFRDKDSAVAVIDGKIVQEGEQVGSKTVAQIKEDRVILTDGQATSELLLGE